MNNQYDDIESTVTDYVTGLLSQDEAEQFETYFLSKPEIIEMIEIAQERYIGEQDAATADARGARQTIGAKIKEFLGTTVRIPAPVLAFAGVAALSLPAILNFQPSNSLEQIQIASFGTMPTRSGSGSSGTKVLTTDLSVESGRPGLFIKVKPGSGDYFRAIISDSQTSKILWKSEPFEVSKGLRDRLITIPPEAAIKHASVQIVAVDGDSTPIPVEFCHYSEVCK